MRYKYSNYYRFYNLCDFQHNSSIILLLVRQSNLNYTSHRRFLRCSFGNFIMHWQQDRICILCLMTKDCIHRNIYCMMPLQNILYNYLNKRHMHARSIEGNLVVVGLTLHRICNIHPHKLYTIGHLNIMHNLYGNCYSEHSIGSNQKVLTNDLANTMYSNFNLCICYAYILSWIRSS